MYKAGRWFEFCGWLYAKLFSLAHIVSLPFVVIGWAIFDGIRESWDLYKDSEE